MKKLLVYLFVVITLPIVMVLIASIFVKQISIGQGSNILQDHLLGKTVMVELNGLYKDMDVEEYIVGVLPGIIPADYNLEAIRAQAVLVRTNVLKEMLEGNTKDASDLSYVYLDINERKELWGEKNYRKNERTFEQAVINTAGQVVTNDGELIMAMYHEVSIGSTASAKEILGEDISYLQSVDSNQDVEAKNYMKIVEYDVDALKLIEGLKLSEDKIPEIEITDSSKHGYVKKINCNGHSYTGEEALSLFSLPSTNFYVESIDDGVRFVCLGKGNGLGVSQYGANVMAQNGSSWSDIIKYYYQGITIERYCP